MITNADCTIFNRKLDKSTRTDVWYKTYIRGVYWEDSRLEKRDRTTGITDDSKLFVCVPAEANASSKTYVKPNEYKAASPEAAFTFANEDIIIKGIIAEDIDSNTSIASLQQKYDDMYIITGCTDYRFGGLPHFEVIGK